MPLELSISIGDPSPRSSPLQDLENPETAASIKAWLELLEATADAGVDWDEVGRRGGGLTQEEADMMMAKSEERRAEKDRLAAQKARPLSSLSKRSASERGGGSLKHNWSGFPNCYTALSQIALPTARQLGPAKFTTRRYSHDG